MKQNVEKLIAIKEISIKEISVEELLLKKMNGELNLKTWENILFRYMITDEILDVFQREIPWKYVFEYNKLSMKQLEKYKNNFSNSDWIILCESQYLTNEFIVNNIDKLANDQCLLNIKF